MADKPFCFKEMDAFVDKYKGKIEEIDPTKLSDMKKKFTKSPPPSAFMAQKAKGGKLSCSMDGLTKMMKEILALALYVATFAKETFAAMLSQNL